MFGLVSLGTFCSGTLIRPRWVLSAAHCVEIVGSDGEPVPDPARPGQNRILDPSAVTVSATWGGGQSHPAVRIETFRPYDVALLQVDAPFAIGSIAEGRRGS